MGIGRVYKSLTDMNVKIGTVATQFLFWECLFPIFGIGSLQCISLTTHTHCTENLKHIFPEMKLRGLFPNFYIHVSGSNLCIPTIDLIWNHYFPVLHERTLG